MSQYRTIPAIHRLLELPSLVEAVERFGRPPVIKACRSAVDRLRRRINEGTIAADAIAAATEALELGDPRRSPTNDPIGLPSSHQRHRCPDSYQPRKIPAADRPARLPRIIPRARVRSGDRQAGATPRTARRADRGGLRRRSGGDGQQQCRRSALDPEHPRHRPGGHRLAQPAHRDRRLVPAPRCDGRFRLPSGRGRLHQPDPSRRTSSGPSATTPPPFSWPTSPTSGSSASPPNRRPRTSPSWRTATSCLSSSIRDPAVCTTCAGGGCRPSRRWANCSPMAPIWSVSRATSSSADPRPGSSSVAASGSNPSAATRSTGRSRPDKTALTLMDQVLTAHDGRSARGDPALRHDVDAARHAHPESPSNRRPASQARDSQPVAARCEPPSAAAPPPRRPCPATAWRSLADRRFTICSATATRR